MNMMLLLLAPVAPAYGQPWAWQSRGCAPPASPKCFQPARTRLRRKAGLRPRFQIWVQIIGNGTCMIPSRDPIGLVTRTRWNIWRAKRRKLFMSLSIMACHFRAPKKVKFISGHLAGIPLSLAKARPYSVPAPQPIERATRFCTRYMANR